MSEATNGDVLERGLLIGGNSVPSSSGNFADDISPWDGEVYARVAAGTAADVTLAADAAEAAFPGWSRVGAFERREIFLRAAPRSSDESGCCPRAHTCSPLNRRTPVTTADSLTCTAHKRGRPGAGALSRAAATASRRLSRAPAA